MEKSFVSKLLICIGMNPSYRGYPYLTYIVCRIASDHTGVFFTCKSLYQSAAEYFHVSPDSVQHSIRTLLNAYWEQGNDTYFYSVTGYPDSGPLPPKEFITVLTDYLQKTYKG